MIVCLKRLQRYLQLLFLIYTEFKISVTNFVLYKTDFTIYTNNKVGWFMMFKAIFNDISVISWRSVFLLVEETGVPGENHRPVQSHLQTLLHNVVSSTPRYE